MPAMSCDTYVTSLLYVSSWGQKNTHSRLGNFQLNAKEGIILKDRIVLLQRSY